MAMTRTRYSEAFKRQVVQDLEQGKYRSLHSACRAYGIGGTMTVSNWVRRYGREDVLPKNVRIETLKERDELKEAKKRIRELEAAMVDSHMDYCLEKSYFRIACERMGVDAEEFKKKNVITLSEALKAKGQS